MMEKEISEKLTTFFIEDFDFENMLGGTEEETLTVLNDYVRSCLSDLADGESITFTIRRKDMTQDQIDALPEI